MTEILLALQLALTLLSTPAVQNDPVQLQAAIANALKVLDTATASLSTTTIAVQPATVQIEPAPTGYAPAPLSEYQGEVPKYSGPTISEVYVGPMATYANISWKTDVYVSANLYLGTSSDKLSLSRNAIHNGDNHEGEFNHDVQLQHLTPETTYYFQIAVWDSAQNKTLAEIKSFHTTSLVND